MRKVIDVTLKQESLALASMREMIRLQAARRPMHGKVGSEFET